MVATDLRAPDADEEMPGGRSNPVSAIAATSSGQYR
jgi:hypothetical protein